MAAINTVGLAKAHVQALRREVRLDIDKAIENRSKHRGEAEGAYSEWALLACADTWAALQYAGKTLGDAEEWRPGTVDVTFNTEAVRWMLLKRQEVRELIAERDSGEGTVTGWDACAKAVFLLHTLALILDAQDAGELVALDAANASGLSQYAGVN